MLISLSRKEAEMKSLYHAYEAYERRFIRGEFDFYPKQAIKLTATSEPLMVQIGDLLIHTGLRLKRRYAAGKPMAWSPLIGSKP